jgi:hypothetical protein
MQCVLCLHFPAQETQGAANRAPPLRRLDYTTESEVHKTVGLSAGRILMQERIE